MVSRRGLRTLGALFSGAGDVFSAVQESKLAEEKKERERAKELLGQQRATGIRELLTRQIGEAPEDIAPSLELLRGGLDPSGENVEDILEAVLGVRRRETERGFKKEQADIKFDRELRKLERQGALKREAAAEERSARAESRKARQKEISRRSREKSVASLLGKFEDVFPEADELSLTGSQRAALTRGLLSGDPFAARIERIPPVTRTVGAGPFGLGAFLGKTEEKEIEPERFEFRSREDILGEQLF